MDITLQRRMLVLVLSVALAVVVAIVLPKASSAAPPNSDEHHDNGEAPVAVNSSVIMYGSCAFPVQIVYSGKAKTIELPDEDMTIWTSPGTSATLTKVAKPADNQVSYLITGLTGAYHQTEPPDGEAVEVVTTGRTLLFGPGFGYLAIGQLTFEFNYEESSYEKPPTGKGRIIDVCERLE